MSSQPPTTPRIEDLRARLRLDPKARHFYPLAEELRKMGQLDEAEKILGDGLAHHPNYLSAWMSLGRIHAEKGEHRQAVDALLKALAIDPGNVVCAKLLATSYLALGEKVEALKKLKLVRAVMPGDEEVDGQIARLEGEIAEPPGRPAGFAAPLPSEGPPPASDSVGDELPPEPPAGLAAAEVSAAPPVPEPPATDLPEVQPDFTRFAEQDGGGAALTDLEPAAEPDVAIRESEPIGEELEDDSFASKRPAASPFITEPDEEAEPVPRAPLEAREALPEEVFAPSFEPDHPVEESIPDTAPSPFAEPAGPETSFSEPPEREQMEEAVPESFSFGRSEERAEHAEPFSAQEPSSSGFESGEPWPAERDERGEEPAAAADERTATLTMAELYASQGHHDAAREIYERVLERDPANEEVRARLAELSAPRAAPARDARHETAARLERWLEKVGRREL
jgi:tetratricopeptide (TPR) repeat protein